MAGIGKWAEEIRRKLGEWAQALEERFAPQPEPIPVRVPVSGSASPQSPRR